MALREIYLKLSVTFADDPKVRALARYGVDGILARDLYVQMCLHCKRLLTDGFVAAEQVGLLSYPLPQDHADQLAKQLASVGLIKEVSNLEAQGWQVVAYLKRNGTKEDVEQLSEVRAEAGRTGGTRSRRRPGQNAKQANRKQVAKQKVSQPDPYTETDTETDKELTTTSSDAGASAPAKNIGHVVAAFVDGAVSAGQPTPASSLRARVGKQARELLADGFDIEGLIASARSMGVGEWNDLAVQVRKDAAAANGSTSPPAVDRRQAATDAKFDRAMERARAREAAAE